MSAKGSSSYPFRSTQARDRYLANYDSWAQSWPAGSETRMVCTEAGETLVRIDGPADAPPLVLLPSSGCNSLLWIPDIEKYSTDYRTYALDAIYDNGRSVDARPVKSAASAVRWLDGLFDALGLVDGINMLGQSMGGYVTAEYLLHAPERVAKAIILGPPGVSVAPSGGFTARMFYMLIPSRVTYRAFVRWVMPVAAAVAERDADAASLLDDVLENMLLAAQCFKRTPFVMPRVLTDDELSGINVPVLYLEAEHERVCPPAEAVARLNAVAPQIETAVIPGADHSFSGVEPDAVHAAVLQFLAVQSRLTQQRH